MRKLRLRCCTDSQEVTTSLGFYGKTKIIKQSTARLCKYKEQIHFLVGFHEASVVDWNYDANLFQNDKTTRGRPKTKFCGSVLSKIMWAKKLSLAIVVWFARSILQFTLPSSTSQSRYIHAVQPRRFPVSIAFALSSTPRPMVWTGEPCLPSPLCAK